MVVFDMVFPFRVVELEPDFVLDAITQAEELTAIDDGVEVTHEWDVREEVEGVAKG